MSKNKESIPAGESQQSEEEIVKEWLVELGGEIKKREEFLKKFGNKTNSQVVIRRCLQCNEELLILRSTKTEYEKLLDEAVGKKP